MHPQFLYPQGPNPFFPQALQPQGFYSQGGPQSGAGYFANTPGNFANTPGNFANTPGYFANTPGYFANTPYGLPQHALVQGPPPLANWQDPAQQAIQQLLAQQWAAQLGTPGAGGAIGGLSNGTGVQASGAWPQHNSLGQLKPTVQQQWTPQQSFQQLAQHHYAIAQQLLQLAAQQTLQGAPGPYAGQFVPGQAAPFMPTGMGGSFVPGITMH
jgi:hypothetical protein